MSALRPSEVSLRTRDFQLTNQLYQHTGDLDHARETALEVLDAPRRSGDQDGVAFTSFTLASVALAAGDLQESRKRVDDCLAVAQEIGFREVIAYPLGLAAALALALGSSRGGALLIGARKELLRQGGVGYYLDNNS